MLQPMEHRPDRSSAKNQPFRRRVGFALHGIAAAWRRERSFRSQCGLALAAAAALALLRPGAGWTAAVLLSCGLVLALELVNAAIEYLLDHLHPGDAPEIGLAKDAAAGAVLMASIAAAGVGAAMLLSVLG